MPVMIVHSGLAKPLPFSSSDKAKASIAEAMKGRLAGGRAAVPRAALFLAAVVALVVLGEAPTWLSACREHLRLAGAGRGSSAAGRGLQQQLLAQQEQQQQLAEPGQQQVQQQAQQDQQQTQQQQPEEQLVLPAEEYTPRGLALQKQILAGKKVEWLHLPKTGTSFGNTIIPWTCPRMPDSFTMIKPGLPGDLPTVCLAKFNYAESSVKPWKVGDHVSLTRRTEEELSRVFTLLRHPRERLASGFHHVQRYRRMNATQEEICDFVRRTTVSHAGVSAQVRMIAGDEVKTGIEAPVGMWRLFSTSFNNNPPTQAMVDLACERVRKFAFVGITPFYDTSVCLFHAMYGGRVRPNEYKNVRKGDYTAVAHSLKEVDCGDRADEALFECGLEVFLSNLRDHPQCLQGQKIEEMRARALGASPPAPAAEAARGGAAAGAR